jgi:hypothetical protein
MKLIRSAVWLLGVSVILTVPAASAVGEDGVNTVPAAAQPSSETHVILEAPDWETVLQRLFGTPDSGLLDGTRPFEFRAEDVTLTALQSSAFFTSPASPGTLAALAETTQTLHGTVRLEGTIDGQSFELKIAGHELKLEGLTLTSEQLQALVAELKASGLHEMKIQALVDGEMTVIKVQRNHEKIEILGRKHEQNRDSHLSDRGNRERPGKIEIEHRSKPERIERLERPGRFERPEKPERLESGRR